MLFTYQIIPELFMGSQIFPETTEKEVKHSPVAAAGAPGRTVGQRNAWKLEAHSSLTVPITALCNSGVCDKNRLTLSSQHLSFSTPP